MGIFIIVNPGKENWYNKNIKDASKEERKAWYKCLEKSEIEEILEKIIKERG